VGTSHRWVWIPVALLSGVGWGVLVRHDRLLALVLGLQSVLAPAVALLTDPVQLGWPMVFARYCLVWLPVLLLTVALGATQVEAWIGRRIRFPQHGLTLVLATVLFALGPLPRIHARPNNWTNHMLYQYTYGGARHDFPCPPAVPAFYRELTQFPPGSLRVLEVPWWYYGTRNTPLPCYQRLHRQWVSIGFISGFRNGGSTGGALRPGELPLLATNRAFVLRNFIHVFDHAELRRRAIDFAIFHTALGREMGGGLSQFDVDVRRWIGHYALIYGPPFYEDEWLVVFDLRTPRPDRWLSPRDGQPPANTRR
jgi:hypothetical protein